MDSQGEPSKGSASAGETLQGQNVLRVWRFFFLLVFFVLFLLLLWKAIPVLLLLFAGALIAVALRLVSDALARWTRMPPLVSLTVVLVVLLGGGSVAVYLAAPLLAEQVQELASNLESSFAELEEVVRNSEVGSKTLEWIRENGENGEQGDIGGNVWARVAGVFTSTFSALAGFGLTMIVGVFLAYNPGLYVRGCLRLIPVPRRKRAREVIESLGDTLRWWLLGQLISMFVLATSTWLMLWLLDVKLAAALGLLTGLLTFVPYLGPLIAMVPVLFVAFAESATLMLTVFFLYLIIQNVEANVLMPIVFKKTVHLPPVLTIIAQVLLGAIFGFLGLILATPLMAAGITLVKLTYVEDVLGDSFDRPVEDANQAHRSR